MEFPFKLAERDIDHMILEELHAGSGFSEWISEQIGLPDARFEGAKHSVSDVALGRSGESDILAKYKTTGGPVAILIEDKLAAPFTKDQATRYHERGAKLVQDEQVAAFRTVLVAPRRYIEAVPATDAWDHRLPLESIRDWYAARDGAHAEWRRQALAATLDRLSRVQSESQDSINRFSLALSEYIHAQTGGQLSHNPKTGGYGGMVVISFLGRRPYISMNWKPNAERIELQMERQHLGKLRPYTDAHEIPANAETYFAEETGDKSDFLRVPGPSVQWTLLPSEQHSEMNRLLAAALTLAEIGRQIGDQPAVTDPGSS